MDDTSRGVAPKKADVILNRTEKLLQQSSSVVANVDAIARYGAKNADVKAVLAKLEENYVRLSEENESLKKEIQYLSAQIESVFVGLSGMIQSLNTAAPQAAQASSINVDELASRVAEKIYIPASGGGNLDYDKIGIAVANNIHVPQALVEDIDYDALAEKIKDNITVTGSGENLDYDKIGVAVANNIHIPQAVAEEIDYNALADKLKDNITVSGTTQNLDYDRIGTVVAGNIRIPQQTVTQEIDYDELAKKLTAAMPLQEEISPDYIASKVAEQIIIPAPTSTADGIDIEELSRKVADKIAIPASEPVEAQGC
jgi:hypothetical protein